MRNTKKILNKKNSLVIASTLTVLFSGVSMAASEIDWNSSTAIKKQLQERRTTTFEIDPTVADRSVRYGAITVMRTKARTDDNFTVAISSRPNNFQVENNCIRKGANININWTHETDDRDPSRANHCYIPKHEKAYINIRANTCGRDSDNDNETCNYALAHYSKGQANLLKKGDSNDIYNVQRQVQIQTLFWANDNSKTGTVEQDRVISYRIDPKGGANKGITYGQISVSPSGNNASFKAVINTRPGDMNPSDRNCLSSTGKSSNIRWSHEKSSGYCTVPEDEIFYINVSSTSCEYDNGCDYQMILLYK